MRTYCVTYNVTMHYDTEIKANNKKEAVEKVKEVIGEPLEIEGVWETKGKK